MKRTARSTISPVLKAALKKLNTKHFVSTSHGRTVIYTERYDAQLGRDVLDQSSADDIRLRYSNCRFDTKNPKTGRRSSNSLGEIWLHSPYRRQFEGIVFDPAGAHPGYYNLWRGFNVRPLKGNWSLMQNHIKQIICSNNPEHTQYLMQYLAYAVQYPARLPGVAVVLRGREGVGKGALVEHIGRLFGRHYYKASTSRQLTGQFGAHLANIVILFADEAVLVDQPDAIGVLKGYITEPLIGLEEKYRTARMAQSCLHIFMASNADWVVPAAADARRFFVLDVSDARKQDRAYFRALYAQMRGGGLAAMLYDLQHLSVKGFDPAAMPKTEALLAQKLLSLSLVERWWLTQLERRQFLGSSWYRARVVARQAVVEAFLRETGNKLDARVLGAGLRKLLPGRVLLDASQQQYQRTWEIPSLVQCRASFNQYIGHEYFKILSK
jgi:hypothetical protein